MTAQQSLLLRVSLFLLITATIGVVIAILFFKDTPVIEEPNSPNLPLSGGLDTTPTETTSLPSTETPTTEASATANGGLTYTTQLTTSAITAPHLSGNSILYYDETDGYFYTIDTSGTITIASDESFPQASSITFSNDGTIVAIEFPDGNNILYDLQTNIQTTLPSHWSEFTFSSKDTVAAKAMSTEISNRALVVTNENGTNTQAIAALGNNADEVTINWSPDSQIVAFSETGRAQSIFGNQELYIIDSNGEAIGTLVVEGINFSAIWSPDSTHIVYSVANVYNNERASLWYVGASGTKIGSDKKQIPLETWVEKCTFKDAITLICAVPKEGQNYSGTDHEGVTSGDNLYQINLKTNRVTLLASPVLTLQMFNLYLSQDQKILYFTDQYGRLNVIRL